jgi:AbiV family abortive infection protein
MKLTRKLKIIGAEKSLENAQELVNEANLLFDNKSYPRSFTLFQLAMEEVGKASLLMQSVIFKLHETDQENKKLLKELRQHKLKTEASQRIDYMIALSMDDRKLKKTLLKNVIQQNKSINTINDFKNYSLYVSDKDGTFKKPSEIVRRSTADDFKFLAEIRLLATKQFHDFLIPILDDFIKYLEKFSIEEVIKNPSPDIQQMEEIMDEIKKELPK